MSMLPGQGRTRSETGSTKREEIYHVEKICQLKFFIFFPNRRRVAACRNEPLTVNWGAEAVFRCHTDWFAANAAHGIFCLANAVRSEPIRETIQKSLHRYIALTALVHAFLPSASSATRRT